MRNYLINLADATDRLSAQEKQFSSLSLNFERIDACRDDECEVSHLRWWCAVLRPRVKGEIGCALSHRKVYRLIAERKESCAAVFEDDVLLSPHIIEALRMAEAACLSDPQSVVLLGKHHHSKRGEQLATAAQKINISNETRDDCTEGYVIGCRAAAALAEAQRKVRSPADFWNYFRKKKWIHLKRVEPPVCGQAVERFPSQIGERYVVAERPLCERLWWKLRRIVGITIDGLLDGGLGW